MLSVAALAACLYLLYTVISTIRVLYYHPLSHIPGPTLWIAFPIFRHLALMRGRQDSELRALHQQHGEVVRFAPDEVSFITAQAWRDIYGHGHKQLPKFKHSAANPRDIISANDADHSRYRKAMSHAFSAKGLQAQEPILKKYVEKLIARLEHEATSEVPVDMVKWYNLTTFDLIGDLAFGQSFGGLENSQYHFWVSTIFDSVRAIQFVKVKDVYPMLFQFIKPFISRDLASARQRQQDYSKAVVQKRLANPEPTDLVDFMDSMVRHRGEKDGLSDEELVANSSILVIAGSETTATLLSGVTFLLLKNPAAMEKLTHEVRTVMQSEEDITFANATANLPYMLACIEEAFRRYPPVPTGLQRVTTSPTLISGYAIPPNVSPNASPPQTPTNKPPDPRRSPPIRSIPLPSQFPPRHRLHPRALAPLRKNRSSLTLLPRQPRRAAALCRRPPQLHRPQPGLQRDARHPRAHHLALRSLLVCGVPDVGRPEIIHPVGKAGADVQDDDEGILSGV